MGIENKPFKCAVCGEETLFPCIVIRNEEDTIYYDPEDDGKPEDDKQVCPYCGYVNNTISTPLPEGVDEGWLHSESYVTCDGMEIDSELARMNYRLYLVRQMANDGKGAMLALVGVGAQCYGSGRSDLAKQYYSKAADMAYDLFTATQDWEYLYPWAILMERLERFDELLAKTDGLIPVEHKDFWERFIDSHRKAAKIRKHRDEQLNG